MTFFSPIPGFAPAGAIPVPPPVVINPARDKAAFRALRLTASEMAMVRAYAKPAEPELPSDAPAGLIPASPIKVTGGEIDYVEAITRLLVWKGHAPERARSISDVAVALAGVRSTKRGRKRSSPHLFPRGKYIYMTDGWEDRTTGFPIVAGEDYRTDVGANSKLAEMVETRVRKILGRVLKRDVTVSEMFATFLMHHRPGSRPDALDAANHARIANELDHLERYMGGNTLQDIGVSTGKQYLEHATATAIKSQKSDHEDPSEIRYIARRTARAHVVTFVMVTDWYCGGENRIEPIRIDIPSVPRTAVEYLTIEQIMRLISAARGRIYDKHGRIVGHHDKRARYACVVRFVVIYLYGGTRHRNIVLLTWGKDSITGHIDPAGGIIERQGPLAPITTKRRETSWLIGSLVELAKRWEKEDEEMRRKHPGRYVHIIHDENGDPIAKKDPKHEMDAGNRMAHLFREVRELAGLPRARPHMLKHSGVTYSCRAGMPVDDIEHAFSTSYVTLWTYYRALRPQLRKLRPEDGSGSTVVYDPKSMKLLALSRRSRKSKDKLLAPAA